VPRSRSLLGADYGVDPRTGDSTLREIAVSVIARAGRRQVERFVRAWRLPPAA
jgi:hypothetical protein